MVEAAIPLISIVLATRKLSPFGGSCVFPLTPFAQANIGREVWPVLVVRVSVPHKAKDVLNEFVPLRIPKTNTLSPLQLHRSPAGAGSVADSKVKSPDEHEVGKDIVCENKFPVTRTKKTKKQDLIAVDK